MADQGLLIIISSPSGGGKDSVINALLKIFSNSARFLTTTSRPPRPGNKEGIDYHFITSDEFQDKIKRGEFLEYNFYAGNYYGTEKERLEDALARYDLAFTQIEVNGKHNLDKAGVKNISVYLLPENFDVLRKRIEKRGGLTEELINERLKIAEKEIKDSADYDYRVVNEEGKLDETVRKIAEFLRNKTGVDRKSRI